MKTILIITSRRTSRSGRESNWAEREKYVQDFCQELGAALDDARVMYTTYSDLEYTVLEGRVSVYDTRNRMDLSEVGLVHFKNWAFNLFEAPVVAYYLRSRGVPFYNSEVLMSWAPGKLAQMVHLADGGVPVPDTFYSSKERLRELFTHGALPIGFSYPLIMKADDGSRGDDNYLIRDAAAALNVLNAAADHKEYVLQAFIPNDGDYRFLFVGLDDEPLVFHRKANGDSHLNNTSKGGTGTTVDAQSLPAGYLDHARKAATRLGREIGGVDILVNKETGDPLVLEVNGTPAMATGHALPDKVQHFADFVRRNIG